MCGPENLHVNTKFLWLRKQAALGDDIGARRVSWLDGWGSELVLLSTST
jgi:hypothetical protein